MSKFYGKIYLTLLLVTLSVFTWTTFTLAIAFETSTETTVISLARPDTIPFNSFQSEHSKWSAAAWIVGTTVLFYQNDQEIQAFFQENQNQSTHDISSFAEHFGNNAKLIPSLGLFYLYGKARKDEKSQRSALLSLESLLIATFLTNTIKFPSTGAVLIPENLTTLGANQVLKITIIIFLFPPVTLLPSFR